MTDIITDKYVIYASSINVFTEIVNENVAMVESSSTVQTYKIKQVLKANCSYKINGEFDKRSITATVGVLNELINVLYTETNKIIPSEYKKGSEFTENDIIEVLKKEIEENLDGYRIEANFNRSKKAAICKYSSMFGGN